RIGRGDSVFQGGHRRAPDVGSVERADCAGAAARIEARGMVVAVALGPAMSRWIALCAVLAVATAGARSMDTHVLIVAGLGGEPQYEQRFRSQAESLARAAGTLTGDEARVTVLSGERTRREDVRRELGALAK